MATITATVIDNAYVRVDVDWSDEPVPAVTVWRVVDGVATQLRSAGPFDEEGQTLLVGGIGVFYDTEMPLDKTITYEARTTYVRALQDTFTRTVAPNGWGTADFTQLGAWTVPAGGNWSVNSGRGILDPLSAGSTNLIRTTNMITDFDLTVQCWIEAAQGITGSQRQIEAGPHFRYFSAGNLYWARLFFAPPVNTGDQTGFVSLDVQRRLSNMQQAIGSAPQGFEYQLSVRNWLRVRCAGASIKVKFWREDGFEPDAWTIDISDTTRPTGQLGAREITGADADLPFSIVYWDNWLIYHVGQTATITSNPVTVTEDDGGWLRDPLRPANDVRLVNECPDVVCPADSRVTLSRFGLDTFRNVSGVFDQFDYPRPAVEVEVRKDLTSTLFLLTSDRAAREQLRTVLALGGPLLLQVPAVYEWDDAYIQIGDAARQRLSADMSRGERRHDLPFAVVDPTVGPSQGTLGARWRDQCGQYATLQAMTDAGVTWQQVLQGEAS